MSKLLKYEIEDLSCQIATLVHNKYLIEGYGINSCNINYKEGDLIEKILVKSILDAGYNCHEFPKCTSNIQMEDIGFITADGPHSPPIIPKSIPTTKLVNIPAPNVKFEFIQTFASMTWKVAHNLGYYPQFSCLDPYGQEIIARPDYSSKDIIILNFPEPLRGRVYFY